MAVSLTQLNNSNLLDVSTWTAGTGSVTGFPVNGDSGESQRLNDTGPYGASALVWGTYPSGNGGADGGWEGSHVSIDKTKLYRYSVWVRRTSSSTGGTFYFGLHSNGTGDVYHLSDGGSQTNPYWDYRSIGWFNQNQWYLVVGHVYPYNYTGTSAHSDSGIYNVNGIKVAINTGNIPNDCKWPESATTGMNRTYHYYCGDNTSRLQFYSPRIEVVESLTPPVATLIKQDLSNPNTRPVGVVYSDGTVQTTNTNAIDSGKLLSVATFTSSGTWAKPAGCNRVFVQVVGGGGGAASYNESGGAGGYAERVIDVTGVGIVTVTVGGGGGAVGYYAAGGDGGTSSFGSYVSASGGYGANRHASHTGGHGGVGSGGDLNILGGTGTGHGNTGGREAVGIGAASFFGAGRKSSHSTNTAGLGYSAPGAGGPGGAMQSWAGSSGAAGMVIVYAYS